MKTIFFELCAETLAAARAAESGGADCIELCSELALGGLTPSSEMMATGIKTLSIPVNVLIRPRGGHFVFSAGEFDEMRQQIGQAKEAGASGVAVGMLLPDRRVDVERTQALVELARPLAVTFHRAFDETPDLDAALESVIETGADNLLTSGGAADVLSGAESLARLCRRAAGRIRVIAGGGLRLSTLIEVVRRSGTFSLHGSLTCKIGSIARGANPEELESEVREAVRLLHSEFHKLHSPLQKM
jgi:copper homeostasis protein